MARWASLMPPVEFARLVLPREVVPVLPVALRIRSCPLTVGRTVVLVPDVVGLMELRFVVLDWPCAQTEKEMPMSASTMGRTRREWLIAEYMSLELLLVASSAWIAYLRTSCTVSSSLL